MEMKRYQIRDIHALLSDISMPIVILQGCSYPIYQLEQTILLLNKATYSIGTDRGLWETEFPSIPLVDALCEQQLLEKHAVSNPKVWYYKVKNKDQWFEFIEDIKVLMEAFDYEIHIG